TKNSPREIAGDHDPSRALQMGQRDVCWSSSVSTDLYRSFSDFRAASTLLPAAAFLSSWISVKMAECRSAISQYWRQRAIARILEIERQQGCDLDHSATSRAGM